MPNFSMLKPPATGTAITKKDGRLIVPDDPIIPFIEGDGTGPDIWRASVRVFDAAVQKAYGGKKKIAWFEVYAGEKSFKQFDNWLPDETRRGVSSLSGRHQGTADDAGGRRHPLAERRAAPVARSLRVPPAGALVQRCAVAGEASREGRHGDLPREHRRHLRRHRIRSRHAGSAEAARLLRARVSEGVQEDSLRHGAGRPGVAGDCCRASARRHAKSASRSASASSRSATSGASA